MTAQQTRPRLAAFPAELARRAVVDTAGLAELGERLRDAPEVVLVAGSSIAGLTLAARLGEAARDSGRHVVLVAGSPPVPRRLIAGCSLRYGTVNRMARAFATTEDALVERLGGTGAVFDRMHVQEFESTDRVAGSGRTFRPPLPFAGMSTRHGNVLDALRASLAPDLPVTLVDGDVVKDAVWSGPEAGVPVRLDDGVAALPLPTGRSVVLNASSTPGLLRPGRPVADPTRFVVAVQAACRPLADAPACGAGTAWAPTSAGAPAPHLAFFTPFGDPQIPDASWYGINTMVVSARQVATYGKEQLIQRVSDRLLDYERALGLVEVDPDGTRAGALTPVVRDTAVATEEQLADGSPVVTVHRAFSSGAPAINVDGMLASVVGSDALATAYLAATGTGQDPASAARGALAAADAALTPIRRRNVLTETVFFRAPRRVRTLVPSLPDPVFRAYGADFAGLAAR